MIRQCYRAGSHDGGLLPSYEEYARLADAKAAGANSSAHIMITGHLAPPPASAGGYRVRRQDVEGKCTSCGIGPAVGRVWTASSASQHRWCRQCRSRCRSRGGTLTFQPCLWAHERMACLSRGCSLRKVRQRVHVCCNGLSQATFANNIT